MLFAHGLIWLATSNDSSSTSHKQQCVYLLIRSFLNADCISDFDPENLRRKPIFRPKIRLGISNKFSYSAYFNVNLIPKLCNVATKAYVLSFSRALNCELKEKKITVTSVCPGPVDTDFFDIAGDNGSTFKKKMRVPAEKVVDKAIKDAALGNELSVYSAMMKTAEVGSKIVPHKLLMKFFDQR